MDAAQRIAELEAELAARDVRIAQQDARIARQDARIAELGRQLAELTEKLEQNSKNSNQPPSSDSGTARAARPSKPQSTRKRGGQKGHRGAHRELVPKEQVDVFVECFPPECEKCWQSLPQVFDEQAKRHQVTELEPIKPHTTEYRRHQVTCACCGYKTRAAYDAAKIPASPLGPRLLALVALFTGVYHVSRRKTVELLHDVLGLRISLGAISAAEARVAEAVLPAVTQAWEKVTSAGVKHTDGTSWRQAGEARALWTIATKMATVFKIVADSSKQTLVPLYGTLRGILVSDRAKALTFWAMQNRQICWAHLLRRFVAFSERAGPAADIGKELLDCTAILFVYWRDFVQQKISRARLRELLAPLRAQIEGALLRAQSANIERLSGSCKDILLHKKALWTFVEHDGVEPTNNHAERELRAFVLWRKRSFGTQSDRGNLFAERAMTVAHTARKQKVNVLCFFTACCRAAVDKSDAPLLFAR